MRALRYHGTKDLRVDDDVPEPKCGPNQIKIKPAFIGICGTDLQVSPFLGNLVSGWLETIFLDPSSEALTEVSDL